MADVYVILANINEQLLSSKFKYCKFWKLATDLRQGGRFYSPLFHSNHDRVKELIKSVHICQSYY